MGSGYGGIYTGTFGDAWMNGTQLDAVAPAIRNLTSEKAAALVAALGGLVVLDEVGLPDLSGSAQKASEVAGSIVADREVGALLGGGEDAGPVELPEADAPLLAELLLSVGLLTWARNSAVELGLEGVWESDGDGDERSGIYEN